MQLLTLACAAACLVALGASTAVAQDADARQPANSQGDYQFAPGRFGPDPNVQAEQSYQAAMGAYDKSHAEIEVQRNAYDKQAADYRAQQQAYRAQMDSYERARAVYFRRYGPGVYATYHTAPNPPPSPN